MSTIYDIAKAAGISPSTVATVLRGDAKKARISDARVAEVMSVAHRLGYRPNTSARAMRQRRFGAVALLQSSETARSVLPTELLTGIQSALRERNQHMLLADLPDERLTSDGYIPKILREMMCDGLLVNYNAGVPQAMVEVIQTYQVPSIWINTRQNADCVYPDDIAGGREATEYLLKKGHRRIAYVDYVFADNNPVPVHYSTHDRFAGYAHAMREAGMQPRLIRPAERLAREGLLSFSASWMRPDDRPTAVITYNSQVANPLIYAATSLIGLKIPKDLSVITFHFSRLDDLGLPVTTMVLPEFAMGIKSVELLSTKIADPVTPLQPVALAARLEEGSTVANMAF